MAHIPINREAALRKIAESRVEARWFMYDSGPSVGLALPYGCEFGGDWLTLENGTRHVSIHPIEVPLILRRRGLATRLVSALSHVAITTGGFETYGGSVESPHMIGLLDKVYGPQNVSYRKSRLITRDEAREILAGYEQHQRAVIVSIELGGFSPDDFEAPEIIVPLGDVEGGASLECDPKR